MPSLRYLLLLLTIASSTNAIFLYFADNYFGVNVANLYVIDTQTNRISIVGTIQDAAGNKFSINSLYYLPSTGKIYGVPGGCAV
jgi:hypothetical protein